MSSTIYFVTDVELDGPDPSRNSMISFASAALDADSGVVGTFEVNIAPLAGRSPDPHTAAWWATQPLAYEASTRDPRAAEEAMIAFADWVESFAGVRVFAFTPTDARWRLDRRISAPLRRRARRSAPPGKAGGCSMAPASISAAYSSASFGWSYAQAHDVAFPADWLGGHEHTHRAIDDALGYANVLHRALRVSAAQPKKHEDFRNVHA